MDACALHGKLSSMANMPTKVQSVQNTDRAGAPLATARQPSFSKNQNRTKPMNRTAAVSPRPAAAARYLVNARTGSWDQCTKSVRGDLIVILILSSKSVLIGVHPWLISSLGCGSAGSAALRLFLVTQRPLNDSLTTVCGNLTTTHGNLTVTVGNPW